MSKTMYLLFLGEGLHTGGGIRDLVGVYGTQREAEAAIEVGPGEWAHDGVFWDRNWERVARSQDR